MPAPFIAPRPPNGMDRPYSETQPENSPVFARLRDRPNSLIQHLVPIMGDRPVHPCFAGDAEVPLIRVFGIDTCVLAGTSLFGGPD